MSPCTLPVSLNCPGTLYCETGWSVSAWKVPLKLSLSLENWFHRKMDLYNLDPLLHGISCCLIHWSWEIKLWSNNQGCGAVAKLHCSGSWTLLVIIWLRLLFVFTHLFSVVLMCFPVEWKMKYIKYTILKEYTKRIWVGSQRSYHEKISEKSNIHRPRRFREQLLAET